MALPRSAWIGSALTLLASSGVAQVKASEPASVSQTIDGTTMTIEYSRPRARGRKNLFGSEVRWGEVWTAGANKATTLEISRDITLEGQRVPKGKYSVWLQVRKSGYWTALIDTNAKRFHTQRPDTSQVAIRFPVKTSKGPYTETLTWGFENVRLSTAQLTLRWENTVVALDLAVEPTFVTAVPEATAAEYVGAYDQIVEAPTDTTQNYRVVSSVLQLEYRKGSLFGKEDAKYIYKGKEQSYSAEFMLLPNKDGSFHVGFVIRGELASTYRETVYEFKRTDGQVTGMEVRSSDKLQARYTRQRRSP
jgi:hypothetical protein